MAVFDNIKTLSGCNYSSAATSNADIMDISFLNRAREKGIRLPSAGFTERDKFWGAFVFTPTAGISNNVTYFDLASLYPSLFLTLNASPEMIVGTEEELEAFEFGTVEYDGETLVTPILEPIDEFLSWEWTAETVEETELTEDQCVWSYIDTREVKRMSSDDDHWSEYTDPSKYKQIYDPSAYDVRWKDPNGPQMERCYFIDPNVSEGFITETVADWVDEKYRYKSDEFADSLYDAIKQICNSTYGVCGDKNFRLFDWRIGESVTLAGRKVIQFTAETASDFFEEVHDAQTYVAIGDTDGCGLSWPSAPSRDVMLDTAMDAVEYINETAYDDFMATEFGCDTHHMEVEVESFAPSLFVPAQNPNDPNDDKGVKKRYAQWITWDEGDEEDEIEITGLEATRSDTAPISRSLQEYVLEQLLRRGIEEAESDVFERLGLAYEEVSEGERDVSEIAKRGGIGKKLENYGTPSRKPQSIFRGAKYADSHIDGETLGEGSKPMEIYVKRIHGGYPTTYDTHTAEDGEPVDVVSVEDSSNLPSQFDVDYEKHTEKVVKDPLRPIIETVGWSWGDVLTGTVKSDLSQWMS